MGDKIINEVVFLGFCILPVYGLATFADAVIFNLIEFWTGENPIAANMDSKTIDLTQNGHKATLTLYKDGSAILKSIDDGNQEVNLVFRPTEKGINVCDLDGNLLYASFTDAKGKITVVNASNTVIAQNTEPWPYNFCGLSPEPAK